MGRKNILIVDDSPLIVGRLENLLEGLPGLAAIDSAGTCGEALDRLSKPPLPDIVLLDINLPDHSGILLLRQLTREFPAITVIMQSNQSGVFYRDLCLQLGAAYYIDKSTEFELIPLIIGTLTAGSL